MSQRGWKIALDKCLGCTACMISCKSENNTAPVESQRPSSGGGLTSPSAVNYRDVIWREVGAYPKVKREFISIACNHCEKPACMEACPVAAITKRGSDGVVLLDSEACIGCKYCAWACPYGAPQFNSGTGKMEKCTFCVHRIDAGLEPACVTTCVGKALYMEESFEVATSGENAPEGFADPSLTRPSTRFEAY